MVLNETETGAMTALEEFALAWDTNFAKEMREAAAGGPIELARAFVALRRIKDRIDELSKATNAAYDDMKIKTLPEAFDLAGVPSVNLDEGYRVTASHKVYASIKTGMKDSALEWLRANDLGDIVSETVNASTLSAVAKTMSEENRELDPELFSVAIVPSTSITKTKKG